ncbi:hypothetical protein QZH41_010342 [Actinostola sp. cb2023]|nr:hypothetical protein QZH41_010342 [Actinostola sp. cb2023]
MDSEFLGSPGGNLDRSNSEPDVFAASVRPRTCSNLSLKSKTKKRSGSTRDKDLSPQKSMDTGSELAFNASTFQPGPTRNGRKTPTREEVKAHAYDRLQTELHKAQQELKLKDEQCDKLSRVRNQLESELEELTACLFQEAHAMVHEARLKQDLAEKKYMEANIKVDMLQAEVNALKSLVITRTPGHSKSRHRRHSDDHLSPCENCGSSDCDGAVPKNVGRCKGKRARDYRDPNEPEVDVITFREFLQFMDELSVSRDQPFLNRIYQENVAPCLEFTNRELASAVHSAIENNVLSMETLRTKPIFRVDPIGMTSEVFTMMEWIWILDNAALEIFQ